MWSRGRCAQTVKGPARSVRAARQQEELPAGSRCRLLARAQQRELLTIGGLYAIDSGGSGVPAERTLPWSVATCDHGLNDYAT